MADWSSLPIDLLRSILSRLVVADFIRSRAVCHNWSSAAAEFRRIPLLMFAGEDPSTASFFSPSEDKTYQIRLPEPDIRSRIFVGSSHGFLVTADQSLQMHLLNPLTGAQFDLPPLTTLGSAEFTSIYGEYSPGDLKTLQFGFLSKAAALSSSPNDVSDCTIVLLNVIVRALAFTRAKKDKKWTIIHTDTFYRNVAYHDGRLFLMLDNGAVHALDLTGTSLRPSVVVADGPQIMKVSLNGCFHLRHRYLAPAPSGDLLQVWQVIDMREIAPVCIESRTFDYGRTVGIKIFKIDVVEGQMYDVGSLGDQAMFLAQHSTTCLSVAGFPEMRRNHTYMSLCYSVNACIEPPLWSKIFCGVHVCNIEDGSVTPVSNGTQSRKLQFPIWVLPSRS